MILHIQEWVIIKVAEEVDVWSRWMVQRQERGLGSRHVLDSMKWMSQNNCFHHSDSLPPVIFIWLEEFVSVKELLPYIF
jgi:hypothetical protein